MPIELLGSAQSEAFTAFLTAHARIIRQMEQAIERAGTVPKDIYDVLLILEEEPEHRLKMGEIAARTVISRSGITRLIDRMEALGYATREQVLGDRRSFFVRVTPCGLDARQEAWPIYRDLIQNYWGEFLNENEAGLLQSKMRILAEHASKGRV